jgi:hypothetical protein
MNERSTDEFGRLRDLAHPFQLATPAEHWHEARDAITKLGLGAGIEIAAQIQLVVDALCRVWANCP